MGGEHSRAPLQEEFAGMKAVFAHIRAVCARSPYSPLTGHEAKLTNVLSYVVIQIGTAPARRLTMVAWICVALRATGICARRKMVMRT